MEKKRRLMNNNKTPGDRDVRIQTHPRDAGQFPKGVASLERERERVGRSKVE